MISKKLSLFEGISSNNGERGNIVYRVIICDDDPVFLGRMRILVEHIFASIRSDLIVHTFGCMQQIGTPILASCDIAILDIDFENNQYTGIDIARKLRQYRSNAVIIFVTNFVEYAPEGYEVQAFRYVLKSKIQEKLESYIRLGVEQLKSAKETFKIKINGEIIDLKLNDIIYFEAQQHSIIAYVAKDKLARTVKSYLFYSSLTDVEEQLEPQGFIRIHKSYVVNMRFIRKFRCREAILYNDMILRVGDKYYSEQKKKFLVWKGKH